MRAPYRMSVLRDWPHVAPGIPSLHFPLVLAGSRQFAAYDTSGSCFQMKDWWTLSNITMVIPASNCQLSSVELFGCKRLLHVKKRH